MGIVSPTSEYSAIRLPLVGFKEERSIGVSGERRFMTRKRKPKQDLGWAWKAAEVDKRKKLLSKKLRKERKKVDYSLILGKDFYMSKEWRELRYKVFAKYKAACMACGRTYMGHGVVMHCDHIKPRSKHPELALELGNIQILCEDCNLGKSNTDSTDWR